MHTIKILKNKSITILLSVLIAVSLLFGAIAVITPARADETTDTKEFVTASLELSNAQFSESSGNYPASPTSWTGEYVDGGKGELIKGVVDLTPSVYSTSGNEKFKLDKYDEYKSETDIPKTIFGEDTEFGGDKKTLLINTEKGVTTAYAYKSGEMTLAANSFYRFSVWVKTGDFAGQTGATVKLSGLGQNFAFNNINTVRNNYNDKGELVLDKSNNYGWTKYSMYVRTSASLSKTVRLNLGLGDAVNGGDEDPDHTVRPASGYVFFDDVKAERISAFDFASETKQFEKLDGKDNVYGSGNALAINLNETKSFAVKDGDSEIEIGTFSKNVDKWKTNIYYDEYEDNRNPIGGANYGVYNSEGRIKDFDSAANVYGFSKNPWAPYGRAEYSILGEKNDDQNKASSIFDGDRLANIMLISTYDGSEFTLTASGIASPFVKVERFKYYRFSVWVKDDNIEGGDGISILLKGKQIINDKPAEKSNLLTSYTNLNGDSEDSAHYGWKEQVVYIHGSMLHDYDISFELWLGSPDAQSSGIAMFDNVTFTELKYSDYNAMQEADSGNVFTIDDVDNDTDINNGNFLNVGDMDEIKFPMTVAEWSYHTPDTVNARGFSTDEVDTSSAVHGIIPTDADTFNKIAASGAIPGVDRPNGYGLNNVLLLSSAEKTAFCYQSPSITLATDQANKLTVDMMVGRVNGYGASLVLKTTDGVVLSTIENIQDTNKQFRTYTFYIAAPRSEQTVYVEVWLGMNDRVNNKSKLSSGNVYVKQVARAEWTAEENSTVDAEFKAILEKYKYDISHTVTLNSLDYGVYSFSNLTLDYYDVYSYVQNDGYGIPYQWNVTSANRNVISGVFNADNKKDEIYPGFSSKDLSGSMLYIYNTDKNSTRYTYDNSISLVSNKYYRIDIQVKVHVTDEVRKDDKSIGAGLSLTGSTAAFTNIKDTTTIADVNNEDSRDYETFKTYSFYVATGDDGGSIGLDITFGGDTKESYIQGRLIIGGIEMTEIDNLDYEAAQKSTADNVIAVELSESNTDSTDNTNTEAASSDIQYWVIPTILFSALLVAAVIIIIIVRIVDHVKSKKKVTYSTEYDRNDVYDEIERLRAQAENDSKKSDTVKQPVKVEPSYEEEPIATNNKEESAPADEVTEEPKAEEPAPAEAEKPAPAPSNPDDLDD